MFWQILIKHILTLLLLPTLSKRPLTPIGLGRDHHKLINKYLASMDFFVQFNLDEGFNESIKSRYRDAFSYANFSEGEKMRIDLALLFTWRAIAKLKNSVNTNLLVLDEVFDSSLDEGGTEEFLKILHTLDGDTNTFIISHKGDVLTEKFRHTMTFEKVKNFSRIVDSKYGLLWKKQLSSTNL